MHEILIDLEDVEKCSKYNWSICMYHSHRREDGDWWYASNTKIGLLHRFIMNAPKGVDIDHIDHNTEDNRKQNLRICSTVENSRNSRMQCNNTSGYKGVCWDKREDKWMAYLKINYGHKTLGYFTNLDDAIECRKRAELNTYGEYSIHYGEDNNKTLHN